MTRSQLFAWITELVGVVVIGWLASESFSYWLYLIPVGLIAFGKYVEYNSNKAARYRAVDAQLQMLMSLINFPDRSNVRVAFHVKAPWIDRFWYPFTLRYQQATEYAPRPAGKPNRKFKITKGIVGKSFESNSIENLNCKTEEEYRNAMLKTYNYTQREIGKMYMDKKSFLTIPVLEGDGGMVGVLYFDSVTYGVFEYDVGDPGNTNELVFKIIRVKDALQYALR